MIEGQLRECKAFAEKNDIQIVGTYIDRVLSAKTDNRPDFQKMIKDSAKKQFNNIIVLEGMAEYYSAELAEKVIRGQTENAYKCKFNGGVIVIHIFRRFLKVINFFTTFFSKTGTATNFLRVTDNSY